MRRIYLASSWRNEGQPLLVRMLRNEGHFVYDFRNPDEGDHGFHWSSIDGNWKDWDAKTYRNALHNDIAKKGFKKDFYAMEWANTFVLLLPCGRSAHLEAGWAMGKGKKTAILLSGNDEPELMYKLADEICLDTEELMSVLRKWSEP